MKIEVLGTGCPKCVATGKNVHEALKQANIEAKVIHVTDVEDIARRGLMFTPAVAIDGEVKVAGRIPKPEEVVGWLGETQSKN